MKPKPSRGWSKLGLSVALLALTYSTVACGVVGGSSAEPTPITDPTAAIHQALLSMSELNSYAMVMAYSPVGTPASNYVEYDNGDYFERLPADLSKSGGKEYVYADDHTFQRECTGPDACAKWQRQAQRPYIPSLAGTINSVPETLSLVAAELATGWSVVLPAKGVKLTGTVDITPAIKENQRRAFIAAGNSPADAEAAIEELNKDLPQYGKGTVEVTLSDDYHLITHITIFAPSSYTLPGQPPDPYFDVEFSQFNQVSVTAPTDFVDAR